MPELLDDAARVIEATIVRLQEPDLWWQVGMVVLAGGWPAAPAR